MHCLVGYVYLIIIVIREINPTPPQVVMFMDVWQMPMFFFLSGVFFPLSKNFWFDIPKKKLSNIYQVSAYFALTKRTLNEFREERLHRLLVSYHKIVQYFVLQMILVHLWW